MESIVLHRHKQDASIQENMPLIYYTIITNGHSSIKALMKRNIYNEKTEKKKLSQSDRLFELTQLGHQFAFSPSPTENFKSTTLQCVIPN